LNQRPFAIVQYQQGETDVLLGEPPRTAYDLNFAIAGIPVRVHPWFWAVSALFGLSATGGELSLLAMWVAVAFVSILVHELGHALTIRAYGGRPWITLYGMGGLASHQPLRIGPSGNILILLAGPLAGFALAAAVVAAVAFSGHQIDVFGWRFGSGPGIDPREQLHLFILIQFLLWVNIFWGIINLFPVYPLDGGQIARELFLVVNPRGGIQQALWLSVLTGIGLAVFGIVRLGSLYTALFFGFLAYQSYTIWRAYTGSDYRSGRGW